MTVDVDFNINASGISQSRDRILNGVRLAAESAVSSTTKWLERDLEAVTRAAVRGNLWRAWASRYYPNPGQAPAGIVYVSGRGRSEGAMVFWSRPGRILGKEGQWLAIPTSAVPRRGRRRQPLTPVEVEAEYNQELEFIPAGRGNQYPTLNLIGGTNARSGAYREITPRRAASDRRRGTYRPPERIVMFILLPSRAFGNRFSIEPSLRRAEARLTQEYVARRGRLG